ncbi:unnamed protein product [Tuber aestivum]|uniref:Uncharacterized protein n=1 Tax=Tuber aestivum TaxID=59557 RepID=A0A292PXI9_9PEZI|nr:unnamed protein product [Tuber aestivum]
MPCRCSNYGRGGGLVLEYRTIRYPEFLPWNLLSNRPSAVLVLVLVPPAKHRSLPFWFLFFQGHSSCRATIPIGLADLSYRYKYRTVVDGKLLPDMQLHRLSCSSTSTVPYVQRDTGKRG